MPVWGAGFISPDGEDYVSSRAEGLRLRYGQGLYGQDPYSPGGQWRDVWAIPLAWLGNLADWLIYNANPYTAEDRLREWERLLWCVPRRAFTVSERQRMAADVLGRRIWDVSAEYARRSWEVEYDPAPLYLRPTALADYVILHLGADVACTVTLVPAAPWQHIYVTYILGATTVAEIEAALAANPPAAAMLSFSGSDAGTIPMGFAGGDYLLYLPPTRWGSLSQRIAEIQHDACGVWGFGTTWGAATLGVALDPAMALAENRGHLLDIRDLLVQYLPAWGQLTLVPAV